MIKPYLDDPQVKNVLEERLPLAREGELEDVTNTSLYLAPHESNLVTRTILNLDGNEIDSEW